MEKETHMSKETSAIVIKVPGIVELGFFLFLSTWVVTYGWSPRCAVESPYEAPGQP